MDIQSPEALVLYLQLTVICLCGLWEKGSAESEASDSVRFKGSRLSAEQAKSFTTAQTLRDIDGEMAIYVCAILPVEYESQQRSKFNSQPFKGFHGLRVAVTWYIETE